MKKFSIEMSVYVEIEFNKKPTEDEVIEYFRGEPEELLLNLEVDNVEEMV